MAGPLDLRGVIEIVDKASRPLAGIAGGFTKLAAAPQALGSMMGRLGDNTGASRLAERLGSAGRAAGDLVGKLGALAGPLAALGGLSIAGGLGAMVSGFIEAGDEVGKLSQRLGVSAKAWQEYAFAANQADIEQGDFEKSMRKLAIGINDAAGGKNKDLLSLFGKLGISLRNSKGELRSWADMLPEIAAGFERNTNATTRSAMANALFGKSGALMINMLGNGKNALMEMTGEAKKYGMLSDEQVESAGALDDAFKLLKSAWTGFSNAIGAAVGPVILPLINSLKDWIAANRELIATSAAGMAKDLGDAIANTDWVGVGQSIKNIGSSVNSTVQFFGGWKVAAIAVGAVLAGSLISSIATTVVEVAKLGLAVAATAGKMLWMSASAVGDMIVGLRAGMGVMGSFNAVMAANPLGLVIVGVAAVAAGAYLIYKNWSSIVPFFKDLGKSTIDIFSGIGKFLLGVFTGDFGKAWDGIKQIVEGFVGYFKTAVGGIIGIAKSIGSALGLVAPDMPAVPEGGEGGASAGLAPGQRAQMIDAGAQSRGMGSQGRVGVDVRFQNAPKNVQPTVRSSGPGLTTSMAVGYSMKSE